MKKINILVYGMTDKVGGMEVFFINFYRLADHKRYSFDFLVNYPAIAFREEIESNGDRVVSITKRSENAVKNHKEIKKFFSQAPDYDACYMMALDVSNIDFLKYCKKAGIKVRIIHSHNSNMRRPDAFRQTVSLMLHRFNRHKIHKLATHYWACSNRAAEWIFPRKLLPKTEIIHNAIPLERYTFNEEKRTAVRKEFHLGADVKIFGHVGRFAKQKNPLALVDIFEEIVNRDKNALCWMIGEGPLRNEIEQKIEQKGLEDKIVLLGQRSNVPELMQAMDAFVFPSLFEGLSFVVIEAQAAGLPIIASDTLSKEHSVTDLLEYCSLDKPASFWADRIIGMCNECKREDQSRKLRAAGYDIKAEYGRIEDILQQAIKECK